MSAARPSLIKPRPLRAGDRVALVAPASSFNREQFEAGVRELAVLGFEAVYDDRVFSRQRFVAGTAEVRAAVLHDAWRDPATAGIIAVRGGYGSAQVLPLLEAATMRTARKVFVGYSDITALLTFHLQHGMVAFHGPMIEHRLGAGERGYHRESFLHAVTRPAPVGALQPERLEVLKAGETRGLLVGGTLTQLAASLGTPWAFAPPEESILFLEDIGERPYRVERMLTQLTQAGIFRRARGVVFGELPACDEPGGEHLIRDVLRDFAAGFPGPVLFGFPSGHTTGAAWTLPLGVEARIVSSPPAVVIEEAAVD